MSQGDSAYGPIVAIVETDLSEALLTSSATLQHRAVGEMLFMEGEAPAGVYVLRSGEVDLLFVTSDGTVKLLRMATAGRILGLGAVVMGGIHGCSAITRLACEVGFIARDEMLRLLEQCPEVWPYVLRVLSSDVNAVYDDRRSLAGVTRATTTDDTDPPSALPAERVVVARPQSASSLLSPSSHFRSLPRRSTTRTKRPHPSPTHRAR